MLNPPFAPEFQIFSKISTSSPVLDSPTITVSPLSRIEVFNKSASFTYFEVVSSTLLSQSHIISGVSSIIIIRFFVPLNSLIQAFARVVFPVPTPPAIKIFAPLCISSTSFFLYSSKSFPVFT